jgi:hypothetical protein
VLRDSSSCRRSSSSTGRSSPKSCVATRCIARRASPFPRTDRPPESGAALQPGLRDRGVHGERAARHGAARRSRSVGRGHHRVRAQAVGADRDAARDLAPDIGCRISAISSRARPTPRATMSIFGPKCSMPTATMRSSKPAIRSIPRSRNA